MSEWDLRLALGIKNWEEWHTQRRAELLPSTLCIITTFLPEIEYCAANLLVPKFSPKE
jgi:hypothetical protein